MITIVLIYNFIIIIIIIIIINAYNNILLKVKMEELCTIIFIFVVKSNELFLLWYQRHK